MGLVCLGALAPLPALAQAPGPPGPYVLDLHVATSALPQDPGFFPVLPSGTLIPARGLGFDVGVHIYLIRLGPARLGIGASVLRARGHASNEPPPASSSTTTRPVATRPDVDTTLTNVAPQLSLNFGSADGWSYISAGVGQGDVQSATSVFTATGSGGAAVTTPARVSDNPPVRSRNVGGGARWFTGRHVGFSFDVRIHMLSAGAATPKTTVLAASAGMSLK